MTTASRVRYYLWSWARNLASRRAPAVSLASFGGLWLCVQIGIYFTPDKTDQWLQERWWLFLAIGLVVSAYRCRPRRSFVHNVAGRDVTIEVAVGDIFDYAGALVVGSNTTFDTEVSETLISEQSVQGSFTRTYCESVSKLDSAIDSALQGAAGISLEGVRVGKSIRYPLGTTARIEQRGRIAYLVAIAQINEHGSARGSLEGLREALASLWWFVGERGSRERLVAPVLGSGFARLVEKRDQIVREMVTSFIAACSERVFTERLTIVLSPKDVIEHRLSVAALDAFVAHVCRYSGFAAPDVEPVGSAVLE